MKAMHVSNKKGMEEKHLAEISSIQENHKKIIEEIQSALEKEENEAKNKVTIILFILFKLLALLKNKYYDF